jgi:raffinose/stachyose/melibiose transport system permease protein
MFALFYLWPIIQVLFTSLTKWNGVAAPEFIGFSNYTRLFKMDVFLISVKNIALWSLIAATLHVGFGVLVAIIFYKAPPGWKIVRTAFMVPMVISGAAWAMIYRFIFNNDFGLLNNIVRIFFPEFSVNWFFQSPAAFWAISLTWLFYSVVITMVVLADLMAIPTDLIEAAEIDGASSMQVLFRINLPLCRFSIGTSVIMAVTSRISMYEAIALTSRGGPGDDTMTLSIMLVKNITDSNFGMANATAVIMFIMGIAIMQFINRTFRMSDSIY